MADGEQKTGFVKGLRHIPPRKMSAIGWAGRTIDEMAEDIRREGVIRTPSVFRNSVIGGLEIRPFKGSAENVVIIGCATFGTALLLRSTCLLMQRLEIKYVFLEKEYCCGAPLIHRALFDGEDRSKVDALSKEFNAANIELCRAKGAKNIIYMCPWCIYLARRFFPDEPNQLFYVDVLAQHMDRAQFRLARRVGYFGGTPHRRAVYDPDQSFDLSWDKCLELLERVEDLEVVRIPRYCCQVQPQLIFDRAESQGLDTIVVSCEVCYGRLQRIAPSSIRIMFLSDILLEALQQSDSLR